MSLPGVKATNLPLTSLADSVIVVRGGGARQIEPGLLSAQLGAINGPSYETRIQLFADLGWPAGSVGKVLGDTNLANRGVYKKSGASGSGSWARIGPLPEADAEGLASEIVASRQGAADLATNLTGIKTAAAAEAIAREKLEAKTALRSSISPGGGYVEAAGLVQGSPVSVVREVDKFGITRQLTPEGGLPVLRWSTDPAPALVDIDRSGRIFQTIDRGGTVRVEAVTEDQATAEAPMAVILPDGSLSATDGATVPAMRTGEAARAVSAGIDKASFRVALTRPGLSAVTSFAAAFGGRHYAWSNDTALYIILALGQSNMYSWGQNPLVTIAPAHPDRMLMLDRGPGTTVRITDGVPGGETPPVLNPATMTGFTALKAVIGQDPASASAYRMMEHADAARARTRVLVINGAASGMSYANLKQGTVAFENAIAAANRAAVLANALGWRVVFAAAPCAHGEADMAEATYGDMLIEWQGDIETRLKAINGQVASVPFFLSQPSNFGNTVAHRRSTLAMISLHEASLALPIHQRTHVLAGPIYQHAWSSDYLHLNGSGSAANGWTFGDAMADGLWGAQGWDCLRIKSAVRTGTQVDVTYHVPSPPLVIDATAAADRLGIRFFAGSTETAVSNATVIDNGVGDRTGVIRLTLAAVPSGGAERIEYALDGHNIGSGRVQATVPRGAVRDSAGLLRLHPYTGAPLHNWAVHQQRSL
ncbi:hypothetical protein WMC41_15895 [Shinella yambaruensis]|uniref:hypothetical protein n=1 Tax=Shinella yambaruensis TaxID=415996 RepID=UPI003D7A6348